MIETSNDIVQQEQITTLADKTEDYMLEKQIFNEKFYPSYLKYAANAWSELFYDTLYIYSARWQLAYISVRLSLHSPTQLV